MSPKVKSFVRWFLIFAIAAFVSFLLITNAIELPFHDKARDVAGFNSSDQAIDAQGNGINDWQRNNYLDDLIKAGFVLLALFAYWKLLGVYIPKIWARVVLGVAGICAIVAGMYMLSFVLYWDF